MTWSSSKRPTTTLRVRAQHHGCQFGVFGGMPETVAKLGGARLTRLQRCPARVPLPDAIMPVMRPETQTLLETDRRNLIAAVERVNEADRDRRPSEGQWSVAEVLEHLVGVEHAVVKLLTLRGCEPIPPDQAPAPPDAAERVATLRLRDRRIDVPGALAPRGTMTTVAALVALGESRAALLEAARAADPVALERRTYHHAVVGRLALIDWLAFVAHHEARHTAQIDEIAGVFRTQRRG